MNPDMHMVGLDEVVGRWKKEKVLGTGGFGTVVLWRNLDTNNTIALKQCRWGHDASMTPKHRQRWTQEVEIMLRLNHPGVVRAFPVPAPLDVDKSELPLLAMEYCSGGDLRKVLCKPEHCCGLPEKQVRTLVQNIASAISYLHSLRIIHRDLKPENIVVGEINGQFQYKLIDLGYAKQLEHGSLCTSFVGTLQYLAPELFHSQTYTVTVDYWSLGLVTHEAITGQRPFLPNHSPAQWIPIVSHKSSQDICVYLEDDGTPVFSKEIAAHTHISKHFKKEMERWLQVMLEWHPKKRGLADGKTGFDLLDEILEKRFLQVLDVENAQILHCELKGRMLGLEVKHWLERETGIASHDQILISNKGLLIDDCKDVQEQSTYVISICRPTEFTTHGQKCIIFIMILNDRMTPMEYEMQKKAIMQSVFFCQSEGQKFHQLLRCYRAYLMCLLSQNSQLQKAATKMNDEMNRLSGVMEVYKQSLKQDMAMYEKQAKAKGVTSDTMFEHWKQNREQLLVLEKLDDRIQGLSTLVGNVNAKIVDIQRSPFAKSKYDDPLEEITKRVVSCYDRIKRRPKEQRSLKFDNQEIVQLLCQFMNLREERMKDLCSSFSKLVEAWLEAVELQPCVEQANDEIVRNHNDVLSLQERRQRDIWHLMHALVKQVVALKKTQTTSRDSKFQTTASFASNARDVSWTEIEALTTSTTTMANQENLSAIKCDGGEEPFVVLPKKRGLDGHPASYPGCSGGRSRMLRNPYEPQSMPYSLIFESILEESYKERTENESLVNEMKTLLDSLTVDSNQNLLDTEEMKRPQ